YFRGAVRSKGKRKAQVPFVMVSAIIGGWILLLIASFYGWSPVKQIIAQSYEAKSRLDIVRAAPLTGFLEDISRSAFPTFYRRV
ncbi:MAG: hypothetical protein AAF639_40890, partial [Chloroflexota bacterium]